MCPHLPDSLELVPYNFSFFSEVTMSMKGKHFQSFQNIETTTTVQLKTSISGIIKGNIREYLHAFTKTVCACQWTYMLE